jgi:hypothetical protein
MIMYLCCVVGGEGRKRCKFITTLACGRNALLAMKSCIGPNYNAITHASSISLIPIACTMLPVMTIIA